MGLLAPFSGVLWGRHGVKKIRFPEKSRLTKYPTWEYLK